MGVWRMAGKNAEKGTLSLHITTKMIGELCNNTNESNIDNNVKVIKKLLNDVSKKYIVDVEKIIK